jgi:hypothetical protein
MDAARDRRAPCVGKELGKGDADGQQEPVQRDPAQVLEAPGNTESTVPLAPMPRMAMLLTLNAK